VKQGRKLLQDATDRWIAVVLAWYETTEALLAETDKDFQTACARASRWKWHVRYWGYRPGRRDAIDRGSKTPKTNWRRWKEHL
jgi:hypothetical protein